MEHSRPDSAALSLRSGADGHDRPSSPTAAEILRSGMLCQPFVERLNHGRDQAAFEFLARETSLEVLNDCIRRIPDQQITENLVEQVFLKAALLSSEAFTGIEEIRRDLKLFNGGSREEDPAAARHRYDRQVEKLGQHVFALGRRLHQLEQYMATCPLSGSGEQLRGRYGQRVRDLAGDVRFMRQELSRWVRRFVPLKPQNREPKAAVDREFLEGRIDAVVDELGLRIREIHETLSASLFEQLVLFDSSLTRQRLFHRDLENVLDIGQLLDGLSNLFDRVKEFDEERRADQLQRVKTLLGDFRPEQFLSFSGVRESDQAMFLRSIGDLLAHEPAGPGRGRAGESEDPIKVFLLLTGDLIASLRRQQRSRDQSP